MTDTHVLVLQRRTSPRRLKRGTSYGFKLHQEGVGQLTAMVGIFCRPTNLTRSVRCPT